MRKAALTEDERLKKRKEAQEAYRHKVRKFTLQFSLADTEVREWFEQQPDKGKYLKKLILNDKKEKLGGLNDG